VTLPRIRRDHLLLLGLLVLVVLVAAACAGTPGVVPGGSPGASATTSPHPPLEPATPGANPVSLLAWLFNPIFQGLFILLVWVESITGDIGFAIIIMTLVVRTALIPLFRRQIVSTKRMQMVQPELKELQKRYKGDRAKFSQAQMELYKERGVNPASGCLPILLQLPLLLIVYQVISQGLTNPDPTAMLTVFGHQVVDIQCVNGLGTPDYNPYMPCIDTTVTWLNNMDVSKPQVLFTLPFIGGLSVLDAPGRRRLPGPELEGPAPARPVPPPDLDPVRRLPAGRPVHLLDRDHHLRDRPAVPDRRLGVHVPDLRLDRGIRQGPHPALPGRATVAQGRGADRPEIGKANPTPPIRAQRGRPHIIRGGHRAPARTRPPGPPREKALTS
jgi:YidC/Oxa1 family membrane protein insertase